MDAEADLLHHVEASIQIVALMATVDVAGDHLTSKVSTRTLSMDEAEADQGAFLGGLDPTSVQAAQILAVCRIFHILLAGCANIPSEPRTRRTATYQPSSRWFRRQPVPDLSRPGPQVRS